MQKVLVFVSCRHILSYLLVVLQGFTLSVATDRQRFARTAAVCCRLGAALDRPACARLTPDMRNQDAERKAPAEAALPLPLLPDRLITTVLWWDILREKINQFLRLH